MQIAIIQFPGSNCERETMLAVKRAGMTPVEFLWNESCEKLKTFDGFIIVGGFSYEDRSRAGVIAALDPILLTLKELSEAGKPILGICNGAQILVEAGLVPGLSHHQTAMVITENKRVNAEGKILGTGYYNAWVHCRLSQDYQRNAYTRHLTPKNVLKIPMAHAEGRFVISPALLQEIEIQGLNVFQYCDANGEIYSHFPVNPNGSVGNIAAISNKAGNVMAIMPHPERTTVGDVIFKSMHDYIREAVPQKTDPLYYQPRKTKTTHYQSKKKQVVVQLLITDNQAVTVAKILKQKGLAVSVKRYIHWEVDCVDEKAFTDIKKTGVLYNDSKECEVMIPKSSSQMTHFLVRAKDDLIGDHTLQVLKKHFSYNNIESIRYGIVWQFSSDTLPIAELNEKILQTNIIYNPYAHDCYEYKT